MASETLTITDNRTGKQYEIPIKNGAIKATDLFQIRITEDDGIVSYDPGFMNTASCQSKITYIDGDRGILRYRGYPIEQIAEKSTYLETAYLILYGELPNKTQLDDWTHNITFHSIIHENIKKLIDGFHHDAHPMGILVSTVGALSTFYPEAKKIFDVKSRHDQTYRLISKMPTLAAFAYRHSLGLPYSYPSRAAAGVDMGMLVLAAVAVVIGGNAAGVPSPPLAATASFVVLCLALYSSRGLFRLRFRLHTLDDLRAILIATTVAAMIVLTARLLLGSTADVATETARLWAFALAYVSAGRVAWYWSHQRARAGGEMVRPTLIVGAGRVGALVAKRFLDNPELGFRPAAFLDKEPLVDTSSELGVPVVGASWDLDDVLVRFKIEQVVITFSTRPTRCSCGLFVAARTSGSPRRSCRGSSSACLR